MWMLGQTAVSMSHVHNPSARVQYARPRMQRPACYEWICLNVSKKKMIKTTKHVITNPMRMPAPMQLRTWTPIHQVQHQCGTLKVCGAKRLDSSCYCNINANQNYNIKVTANYNIKENIILQCKAGLGYIHFLAVDFIASIRVWHLTSSLSPFYLAFG